eukprot:gene5444-9257_t
MNLLRGSVSLLTVLIILTCFNAYNAEEKPFNIIKVMNGEWNLDVRVYKSFGVEFSAVNSTMNMTDGVHVDSSVGNYQEITKDGKVEHQVHVEAENDLEGNFKFVDIIDKDSDDFGDLINFKFSFKNIGGNSFFISEGNFEGKKGKGKYEFIFTSPVSFILKFETKDEIIRYIGKKHETGPEPSMLQRFGPTLMIVGFIIMSKLVRSGFGPAAPPRQLNK